MPYLYVIRSPRGMRKIGYARDAESRRVNLRTNNAIHDYGGDMAFERLEVFTTDLIEQAEAHIHALLWDTRICGEWFDVGRDATFAAINDVRLSAARGTLKKRPGWLGRKGPMWLAYRARYYPPA